MRFVKRLFCKHEYEFVNHQMIDGGMRKMCTHRCKKCGKVKVYFV